MSAARGGSGRLARAARRQLRRLVATLPWLAFGPRASAAPPPAARVHRRLGAAVLRLAVGLMLVGTDVRAAGCDVQVSLVDFGALDFAHGERITGEVVVACDAPQAFAVSSSEGFGDYRMRRMRGPDGADLRYNLYVDAARRRVWGDGSGGTARLVGQTDGRRPASFTIYGFVPGGQRVGTGPYHDSVTVSLVR